MAPIETRRLWTFVALLCLSGGCIRDAVAVQSVAPRAEPARVAPLSPVVHRPVQTGQQSVIFDVVDGAARISRMRGTRWEEYLASEPQWDFATRQHRLVTVRRTRLVTDWEPLCRTSPCLVGLEPGLHEISLTLGVREDSAQVWVRDRPVVFRHAMSVREERESFYQEAGVSVACGILAVVLGPAIALYEDSSLGDNRHIVGWSVTAGGVGLLLLGAYWWQKHEPDRFAPGTSVQWSPAR